MVQVYIKELLQATGNCLLDRMMCVLNAGVSPNCWDTHSEQNTPLHWAACYGSKATVACLIDAGANVNSMNAYGTTPLHDAVNRGDREIVEELLKHGADPLKLDKSATPKSPLDMATARSPHLLPLFQKYSADLSPSQPKLSNGDSIEKLMRSASLDSYPLDSLGSRQNGDECSSPVSGLLLPQFGQAIDRVTRQTPIKPLVTDPVFHLLWPQPQNVTELKGAPFFPKSALFVSVIQSRHHSIHRVLDVWERARPALLALNLNVTVKDVQPYSGQLTDAQIECIINPHLFTMYNAYQIHISPLKITISCESLSSLHYALNTLTQLFQIASRLNNVISVSPALIYDYPSIKHRAVLLDISPSSRVPSMDYLLDIIEKLSWLKISHLHLYSRLSPTSSWPLCFKQGEMLSIDRYCQDRFISLVPVLEVETDVKKTDLKNMWPLFQQVMAVFTDVEYVHVGHTLGPLLLGEDGLISLSEVRHFLGVPSNVTLMLCANSLQGYSASDEACLNNIILVRYGFQADFDFLAPTKEFFEKGCTMCFSPGTCTWNSLAGCPEAAICNVYRAIQSTEINHTVGIIIAQWPGKFNLTPYLFSWPGFLVGAGLSWNANTHLDFVKSRLAALLDMHIFNDERMIIGQCIIELGLIETMALRLSRAQEQDDISDLPPNIGSFLYRLVVDSDNVSLETLSTDNFNKLMRLIKKVQNEIYRSKLECLNGEMVIQELLVSVDLMLCACKIGRALVSKGINPNSNLGLAVINLGVSNLSPTLRTDIANKLLALIEQYKGIWLQRHVPAGLKYSLGVLSTALQRFVPQPEFQ
ncbi:uncharacterized protein [Bemisia tabaci]